MLKLPKRRTTIDISPVEEVDVEDFEEEEQEAPKETLPVDHYEDEIEPEMIYIDNDEAIEITVRRDEQLGLPHVVITKCVYENEKWRRTRNQIWYLLSEALDLCTGIENAIGKAQHLMDEI